MFFRLPTNSVVCADWSAITGREYLVLGFMAGFDLRGPFSLITGMLLPFQKREDAESTHKSWVFHNEIDGLPDQVVRELQVSNCIPLDFIQRRSQYQAEFSRNWALIKQSDCAVLVGGLHATEIRDYVRYGIDDPNIQKLALYHAQMAHESPLLYSAAYTYHWMRGLAISVVGLTAGLAPWAAAIYGIRRAVFGV